jgi:death on curing protein
MADPVWLSKKLIQTLHAESLHRFGGASGIRDEGLLESALDRPRNVYAYNEGASLFELAATYAHGLIKNHPFVDGNKRAGLLAARAFLFRNGFALHPPEAETVSVIEGVAAGEVEADALAAWLEEHSAER